MHRLVVLCALFLSATLVAESAGEELRHALSAHDIKEQISQLRYHARGIPLRQLYAWGKEYKNTPLMNAALTARAILRGRIATDISREELLAMCLYIDTKFTSNIQKKKYYLPPHESGLPCALEYDPETKTTFIHLGKRGHNEIGRGTIKVVTKAILCKGAQSEVVARCEQQIELPEEWKFTRYLQGTPGVVDAKAFTSYKIDGKTYYNVFCKLYQPGPISRILKEAEIEFSLQERVKIALDIVRGLVGMQEKNVVHRDFCGQNCLVNIAKAKNGSRHVSAVIADLGCAGFAADAKGSRAQGHSCYTAPEGIFQAKLVPQDYYKTDLFAAGALFYCMQIDREPDWLDPLLIRKGRKSPEYRYNKHVWLITDSIKKRREKFHRHQIQKGRMTRKDLFEKIILKMIDPNPNKRGTAAEHFEKLEALYKRFNPQ